VPTSRDARELKQELVALLTIHSGNISAMEAELEKACVQVHRWLRRFGLDTREFRAGPPDEPVQ